MLCCYDGLALTAFWQNIAAFFIFNIAVAGQFEVAYTLVHTGGVHQPDHSIVRSSTKNNVAGDICS
jgi:hypothetical protein